MLSTVKQRTEQILDALVWLDSVLFERCWMLCDAADNWWHEKTGAHTGAARL